MANISIPNLPSQTATTDLDLLVITDSGETTTSKITKADFLDGVGGKLVSGTGADSLANAGNETKASAQDSIYLSSTTPIGSGGVGAQSLGGVIIGDYGDTDLRSSASYTTIINSRGADVNAYNSFVAGGIFHNLVGGGYHGVVGGYQHYIGSGGEYNFLGGGQNNLINDFKSYNAIVGGKNTRIDGSYGFGAANNVNSGYGITSTGSNNVSIGNTADSKIQNSTQQSLMLGSRNSLMSDGRFVVEIGGNGNSLLQDQTGTDATSVISLGNKGCNIGINKSSISVGGVMVASSVESEIGNVFGTKYDIGESIILGSNNSTIKSTGTAVKNVALIGCESVDITDENNVVVLGVNTYTGGTENVVVVPGMVWTNYSTFDYADDTAAATGGVSIGQVYHNNGDLRVRVS